MNVDDDHAEHPPPLKRALEPDPRPPHGPETSFPSRPAFLATTSSSPLATHRSPVLPYPPTAPRVASSPTSAPFGVGSDSGFRRRSNASADSMDSYHGHIYLTDRSAVQGSTMRPGLPTGAPGETPVKLTPITGRVSKAKKGIPVHECDICQPPKVRLVFATKHWKFTNKEQNFTRAEHLRLVI
jgi:hypothetical protein